MDCKEALTSSEGDLEKAIDDLRRRACLRNEALSKAAKEGTIASYIHMGGRIGGDG